MEELEKESEILNLYSDMIGKKVLLRKKSSPNWVIVGELQKIIGTKLHIQGNSDSYTVDYDDILSLDVKGKEKFKQRGE
jgi:hypothetical protein